MEPETLTDSLRDILEQVDGESGKTKGRLLAEKYVELAMAGSVAAIEDIINRLDGKPEQHIRLSGSINNGAKTQR